MTSLPARPSFGPWPAALPERALAAGVGIAAAGATLVLMQASVVWVALIGVALLVLIGAFLVRDAKSYWLTIFLVCVPLNVSKLFFWTPEDVAALKVRYDIFVNENLVPQLYVSDLAFTMLMAIWLGELLTRHRRVEVPRGALWAVGFLGWCVVTLPLARAPELGLVWILYEIKLLVVLLWFVNARLSLGQLRRVVTVLLLCLCLQSCLTVLTFATQRGENVFGSLFGVSQTRSELRQGPARGSGAAYVFEEGALLRGTGTVGTANLEAKYLVLLLPLAAAVALFHERPSVRFLGSSLVVLGVAALALTFSRGGLLTGVLGLALMGPLLVRRRLLSPRGLVAGAGVALGLACLASPLIARFMGSRPGYTQMRFEHTRRGLELLAESPVIGVGMNNFNARVSGGDYGGIFAGTPIHNHYLRVGIETGLVGLVLNLAFYAWAARQAWLAAVGLEGFWAAVAVALLAALLATAVYWSDDLFYDAIIRTQTLITVALAVVLRNLARGQSPAPAAV